MRVESGANEESRWDVMGMTDIPLLFGPYGSGALEYVDRLALYGANACWFHMFDPEAFDRQASFI